MFSQLFNTDFEMMTGSVNKWDMYRNILPWVQLLE